MAKYNKRIVSIKPSSIAMLQGVFWSVIGLGIAILRSLNTTVEIANSTDSVLAGLTLGIAAGAVSIIVVPMVYFGIGWVLGIVQGYVLNYLIVTSGGIDMVIEDKK